MDAAAVTLIDVFPQLDVLSLFGLIGKTHAPGNPDPVHTRTLNQLYRPRLIQVPGGVEHLRVRNDESRPARECALGDLDRAAVPSCKGEIACVRPLRNCA